jgi:tRNA uridine 5-carboxymethylaminomethyl modification enzyme
MEMVKNKRDEIQQIKNSLEKTLVEPEEINEYFSSIGSSLLTQRQKASQLLLRPEVCLGDWIKKSSKLSNFSKFNSESLQQAEIQLKYDVYLEKENELAARLSILEDQVIPSNFNYDKILSLSSEARQKFSKIKPQTLGQASRISGVNPSDVQILMVYMGR